MKWIILIAIRIYWVIPKKFRNNCLFKESCSHFVYRTAKEKGFFCGIAAFFLRKKQCRPGYQLIIQQSSPSVQIRLVDGTVILENEFSDKLVREIELLKNFLPGT